MSNSISIIIPIYNKQDSITACVESVLKQNYKNLEVILIDDGSVDTSRVICEKLSKKYECVSFYHQENKGVSVARNRGIEISKGKFICFIDPDDTIESDFLSRMIQEMKDDVDMVCCTCNAIVDNIRKEQHFFTKSFDTRNDAEKKKDIFYQLMDTSFSQKQPIYTGIGVPWGKLYRSSFIKKNGIRFNPELYHYEDNLFNMEVMFKCQGIVYIDECLYNYSTEHICTVLDKYNKKIIDSYIRLYTLRKQILSLESIDEEMNNAFKIASINLFDIAVFDMLILKNKKNLSGICLDLEKYIDNSGYKELLKYELDSVNITYKRRFLYFLVSNSKYKILCLLLLLKQNLRRKKYG